MKNTKSGEQKRAAEKLAALAHEQRRGERIIRQNMLRQSRQKRQRQQQSS